VFGLALAHHQMIVLAAPAVALLTGGPMIVVLRERSHRTALLGAAFVVPFVVSYALVPLAAAREPAISWGDVRDFASLVRLVGRADYGGLWHASRRAAEAQLLERLDVFFASIGRSVGPVALAFAPLGAWALTRKSRREGWALILFFVASGPLFAALNRVDIHSEARVAFFERFATMCHVPLAVLVGCGVGWLEARVGTVWPRWPAGGLFVALAALSLWGNLRIDFHEDRLGAAYARDLVHSAPDGSVVLLTGDMPAHAALYACGVEQNCGDRRILSPLQLHLAWKRVQVARRFPGLATPALPDGSVDIVGMIEYALATRPVYVHPELLAKEPRLAASFSFEPSLLLLSARRRVEPLPGDAREPEREIPCEACGIALPDLARPSMEAQVLAAYADTYARFRIAPWKGP